MSHDHIAVIKWLANGETGISSETLAFKLAFNVRKRGGSHPHDPSDFNRCLQLLGAAPALKPLIGRMAKVSPHWAKLVARWDEIEAVFVAEVGENWARGRRTEKTYALMKEVLA